MVGQYLYNKICWCCNTKCPLLRGLQAEEYLVFPDCGAERKGGKYSRGDDDDDNDSDGDDDNDDGNDDDDNDDGDDDGHIWQTHLILRARNPSRRNQNARAVMNLKR